MDEIPLSAQLTTLVVLLVLSGACSLSETAMMAANRYRLKHKAELGSRGARLALDLLNQTDQLLGVILLFNNLINSAAAVLVSVITIQLFGEQEWALGAGTLLVTFLILVFSEITPKVIGANNADAIVPRLSFVLTPLLKLAHPVVWFVNLFVKGLMRITRLDQLKSTEATSLSPAELRTLVLESGHFIPEQHRRILLNLFDIENITVDDVMTPRNGVESLDITAPWDEITSQVATSYHTRLPVYEGDPNNVIGVLHMRRLMAGAMSGELDRDGLREALLSPYFVPAGTKVLAQMQFFRENRRQMGLVVDEYGEFQGIVTLEGLVEEIVGKFAARLPTQPADLAWNPQGEALVEGGKSLREINRDLDLDFPLDGPRTLNGLILDYLQDIPESGLSVRINGVPMEILLTEDRMIRRVRLYRPKAKAAESILA